jgi:hypothetical protein
MLMCCFTLILNSIVYNIYIYITAIVCKDKALYLLKFAGLTKVQLKNEVSYTM